MEKPILFSTEMVEAILAGDKIMTRRVVTNLDLIQDVEDGIPYFADEYGDYHKTETRCPYGQCGGLIWVKETHYVHGYWSFYGNIGEGKPKYKFNPHEDCNVWFINNFPEECKIETGRTGVGYFKRPSIFMFKKYARIWLKVKSVRVGRLQDTSEEDAEKEGIDFLRYYPDADEALTAKELFMCLWDSINGKPRKDGQDISWKANPWVWVVEFERVEKPQATKEAN